MEEGRQQNADPQRFEEENTVCNLLRSADQFGLEPIVVLDEVLELFRVPWSARPMLNPYT